MIGNSTNTKEIMKAFQESLRKKKFLKKEAQYIFENNTEDKLMDKVLSPESEYSDELSPDPESFLLTLDDSDGVENISKALDDSIDSLEDSTCESCASDTLKCNEHPTMVLDATATHILGGLGKIAGSLKMKGHIFAADIVEATAISVKEDYLAEAKKKAYVSVELNKIAKDLRESGNIFASDIVLSTIENIKKS